MAQLLVRNLEDDVKERLRKRAKKHGQSMEAEVRDILRHAVMTNKKADRPAEGFGTRFASHFKEIGLREDEDIKEWRGFSFEQVDFDK